MQKIIDVPELRSVKETSIYYIQFFEVLEFNYKWAQLILFFIEWRDFEEKTCIYLYILSKFQSDFCIIESIHIILQYTSLLLNTVHIIVV